MLRAAFVLFAGALLSACASLAPIQAGLAPPTVTAHFDASLTNEPGAAPCEDVVVATPPQETVAAPSSVLHRTSFGPPSRRQPDQRMVLATASDRARWRHARRRRRGVNAKV
jgi:hypothetical protein